MFAADVPPQLLSPELQYGALALLSLVLIGIAIYAYLGLKDSRAERESVAQERAGLLEHIRAQSQRHKEQLQDLAEQSDNRVDVFSTTIKDLIKAFSAEQQAARIECREQTKEEREQADRQFREMLIAMEKYHDRTWQGIEEVKAAQRETDARIQEVIHRRGGK